MRVPPCTACKLQRQPRCCTFQRGIANIPPSPLRCSFQHRMANLSIRSRPDTHSRTGILCKTPSPRLGRRTLLHKACTQQLNCCRFLPGKALVKQRSGCLLGTRTRCCTTCILGASFRPRHRACRLGKARTLHPLGRGSYRDCIAPGCLSLPGTPSRQGRESTPSCPDPGSKCSPGRARTRQRRRPRRRSRARRECIRRARRRSPRSTPRSPRRPPGRPPGRSTPRGSCRNSSRPTRSGTFLPGTVHASSDRRKNT